MNAFCGSAAFLRRASLHISIITALCAASASSLADSEALSPHIGSSNAHKGTVVFGRKGPARRVSSCVDDGNQQGTLRYEVAHAVNGDTIDLASLPCSTITLGGNPIQVDVGSLYLLGPGSDSLTIDGHHASAVFDHTGSGNFGLAGLTVSNGYVAGQMFPEGGCISSQGNVALFESVVSHCTVIGDSLTATAAGGGVYTRGNLTLSNAAIESNSVIDVVGFPSGGGGAFVVGAFAAVYSTISNNTATAVGNAFGFGGGLKAYGNVSIDNSTISGNHAQLDGGGAFIASYVTHTANIVNSTISGNEGSSGYGGIWTNIPTTIENSTIAFNKSSNGLAGRSDGVYATDSLTLNSTIIADNSSPDGPSDLGGNPVSLGGSNDLITSSTVGVPSNTITACPKLEALGNNGGSTLTHALSHDSPAIDKGNPGNLTLDQRLEPRVAPTGGLADIGSVERQPGEKDEGIFVGGFDGVCDQ